MTETCIRDLLSKAQSGLIPITIDLIRELRDKGYNIEAHQLLAVYHANKQENTLQLRKELNNIDSKIRNFEYRKNHPEVIKTWKDNEKKKRLMNKKCRYCEKPLRIPKLKMCPECRVKSNKKHYKAYLKKLRKLRIQSLSFKVCVYCAKPLRIKKRRFHSACLMKHRSELDSLRYEKKKRLLEENK